MRQTRLLFAIVLCASASLPAEESTPRDALVDPNVFSVVTQAWPDRNGMVRVVGRAHGFEHVSSEVVAQWLEPVGDSDGHWSIAASETLVAPGMLALGAPRLSVEGEAIHAVFEGVHSYEPATRIRRCFALYQDRRAVVVDTCGE